jgi:hypothetical protein
MGVRLTVKGVRLRFGDIYEMGALPSDPDNLAYSAKFIIPPDHPQIAEIEAAMLAAAKERWAEKGVTVLANMTKTGRKPEVPFVKQPYSNKDGEVYEGCEGTFTLSCRNGGKNPLKPTVLDQYNKPVTQSDGVVYPGRFVDAAVEFYAPKENFGRRISCTIRGLRRVVTEKDDSAFSNGATAANTDDFGAPAEVEDDFV